MRNNKFTWGILGVAFTLLVGFAFAAEPIQTGIDDILNDHEARITALEGSTTTTLPPTTTTTTPPTTTTQPPQTEQCLVDQIVRDRTKNDGSPKARFDIILNNLDLGQAFWVAPYLVDTSSKGYPQGYGWISGDRPGYKAAYMFLVDGTNDPDNARIIGRVSFARVEGASYVQVNDKYMDEVQVTHLKFDGTCDPNATQAEMPYPVSSTVYEPSTDPDYRPLIFYVDNGQIVENRSYTNTTPPVGGVDPARLRFSEVERITTPFTQPDGVGGTHTVFGRVTVLASFEVEQGSGIFLPVVAVYYDTLVPDVTMTEG